MSTPNGRGWMYERIDGRLISRAWIKSAAFSPIVDPSKPAIQGTTNRSILVIYLEIDCSVELHDQVDVKNGQGFSSKSQRRGCEEKHKEKYKELESETFGANIHDHPVETDKELWTKACGGVKKGNLFGMPDEVLLSSKSCMSSTGRSYTPNTVTTSEVQKLQDELEKQKKKTDEGEIKVALLEERDKEREKAMEKLMEQVALLTKAVTGNLPSNSS